MNSVLIASVSETDRLIISEATLDHCQALQDVCVDWDDKELLEGERFSHDYIYKCLTIGDLPPLPDVSRNFYSIKSIHAKESLELIGFIELYHGYPDSTTLWVSMLVIKKVFRGKGYAQEVIHYINSQGQIRGYQKTGIGVYARNHRALRFWIKAGFKYSSMSDNNNSIQSDNPVRHLHFMYSNSTFDVIN